MSNKTRERNKKTSGLERGKLTLFANDRLMQQDYNKIFNKYFTECQMNIIESQDAKSTLAAFLHINAKLSEK